MFVDSAAVAVLHTVHQRRLHPFATIGEHRIGRHHLVERRFLRTKRVGKHWRQVVIDPEPFGIVANGVHADLLRQTDGHEVPRLFDTRPQGRRPVELVRRVSRPPHALGCVDLDRGIHNDGRRGIAAVQCRSIDKGLEARPRLAFRLCRTVEHRRLIGETALHRDHAPCVHVHRDKAALHFRDLTQGPTDERPVTIRRHAAHQHHVADLKQVSGHLGAVAELAILKTFARPLDILGGDEMTVCVLIHAFDPDAGGVIGQAQHHGGIPRVFQINVTWHTGVRQRFAPIRLGGQLFGRNLLAGAAVDTDAAVIFLKLLLQGLCGNGLHLVVDGGTHGQTAGKEFALAEVLGQLAADFIGKVIARRQFGLEAFKVPVLHRSQGLCDLGLVDGGGDIAVFLHLAQHEVPACQQPVLAAHRMIIGRRFGQRGKERSLVWGEFPQCLVEISLRRGGHTVGVLAQEDLVQIKFKDLFLGQRFLKPCGEDDFLDLAFGPTVAGQKKVLHHLLRDGRCTAHILAPCAHRIYSRCPDAAQVIAFVSIEVLVLGRDEGLFDQRRDRIGRREQAAFLGEFVNQPPLPRINPANRRRRVLRKGFVAGQIAAIHPEHRADGQRDHTDAHGEGGKNTPEERQDQTKHGWQFLARRVGDPSIRNPAGIVKTRCSGPVR